MLIVEEIVIERMPKREGVAVTRPVRTGMRVLEAA
jgi:hypothetical protein